MTPEERAQAAMENAAGGWRAYPNTYASVVAAIREAENEALERAAREFDDDAQPETAAVIRSLKHPSPQEDR